MFIIIKHFWIASELTSFAVKTVKHSNFPR